MRMRCLGILLFCFILTGCLNPNFGSAYNNDRKIASADNSYNLNNYEQNLTDNHLTATVALEGTNTIWTMDAQDGDEVQVTYSLAVQSGKAKLVFIDPDGGVSVIAECFSESESTELHTIVFGMQDGQYRMKVVGAPDTRFTLEVIVTAGDLQEL